MNGDFSIFELNEWKAAYSHIAVQWGKVILTHSPIPFKSVKGQVSETNILSSLRENKFSFFG